MKIRFKLSIYKNVITLSALFAILFLVSVSVNAKTIQVTPGESIQQAIDDAEFGDIVSVAPGDFSENLIIKKGVEVIGAGPGKSNLEGYVGVSPVFEPTVKMLDDSSLKGFYIKSSTLFAVKVNGENVDIQNNYIDADFNGIKVENGSVSISENRIGPFVHTGIYFENSEGDITNNTIETNHIGIILDNSDSKVLRNIISGKTWHDTRGGNTGISIEKSGPVIKNNIICYHKLDGIFTHSNANAQIINNTIYNNYRHGILSHHSSPKIMNNIIATSEYGIYKVGDENPDISYNNMFDISIGNYLTREDNEFDPDPGDGELSFDPEFLNIQFEDAPAGNFELSSGSECKDNGNPDVSYNDKDNSSNDMGAYGGPDAGWIGMHELPGIDLYSNGIVFAEGNTVTITTRTTNFNPNSAKVNKFIVLHNSNIGYIFYPTWSTKVNFEKIELPSKYEKTDTLVSFVIKEPVPAGVYTLYAGLSDENINFPAGIKSTTFEIVNKPVAKFTVTPKTGKAMITVFKVDASESSDVETPKAVLQFSWRWEDSGSFSDWSTAKKKQHKYPAPGTKNITLRVMDLDGFTASTSQTVEVTE